MSKNFEEEYKEYLNAQAPDLWDRIEAGIDASDGPTAVFVKNNVTPIRDRQHCKKNKNRQKYRRYKLITSIAACLFAIVMIIPVYMLVAPKGGNESADMTVPIVLTDATIENTEVTTEENATSDSVIIAGNGAQDVQEDEQEFVVATEKISEEVSDEVAQIEVPECGVESTTGTIIYNGEPEESDEAISEEITEMTENMEQLASSQTEGNSKDNFLATEESADGEADAAEEKTMSVVVTSEGQPQENGILYTAALLETSAPATIEILVPSESAAVLEKDTQYTVTVKADSTTGYYVLVSAQPAE